MHHLISFDINKLNDVDAFEFEFNNNDEIVNDLVVEPEANNVQSLLRNICFDITSHHKSATGSNNFSAIQYNRITNFCCFPHSYMYR